MELKKKMIEKKDRVVAYLEEHGEAIATAICVSVVGGFVTYAIGMYKGVKLGRSEWDFCDEMYGKDTDCSLLVDNNMEPVTVLPNRIIKEILDSHKKSNQ